MLCFEQDVSLIVGILDLAFFDEDVFSDSFHGIKLFVLAKLDEEDFSEGAFVNDFEDLEVFKFDVLSYTFAVITFATHGCVY
jgi:hypothetical protein